MIGYSTPLTMIDTSSKIKRGTKGDASVLQPTALTAVPVSTDSVLIFFFFHLICKFLPVLSAHNAK